MKAERERQRLTLVRLASEAEIGANAGPHRSWLPRHGELNLMRVMDVLGLDSCGA